MCEIADCERPAQIGARCKTCYHRLYYHEVRRARLLAYVGTECARCGSTSDLQFDHVDPEQKSFEISSKLTLSDEVKAELDKCQLLCASCHKEKTRVENSGYEHGTLYGWMKRGCACVACSTHKRAWHDTRNAQRRAAA